jgi:hypothetical protein
MHSYRQRQSSQYTELLCVEMDNRYSLLKDAMVRNIKEYNDKFKARKSWKWTPLLPYIILVVDEFADLIMTAERSRSSNCSFSSISWAIESI